MPVNAAVSALDFAISRGTAPGWMIPARGELGQREVPGSLDNPRILEYHAATKGGPAPDEVAWCSSFLCWVFAKVGIETPRTKRALDWLSWGVQAGQTVGAVAVLDYGGGKGHVGLVVARTLNGRVVLLGGNQNDQVSIKAFDATRVVAYRMPRAPLVDAEMGAEPDTR